MKHTSSDATKLILINLGNWTRDETNAYTLNEWDFYASLIKSNERSTGIYIKLQCFFILQGINSTLKLKLTLSRHFIALLTS